MKVRSLSRVRLLATPCTAAHQAPPSMGFSPDSQTPAKRAFKGSIKESSSQTGPTNQAPNLGLQRHLLFTLGRAPNSHLAFPRHGRPSATEVWAGRHHCHLVSKPSTMTALPCCSLWQRIY